MSRIASAVVRRFTATPLALKVHALLVVGAAVIIPGGQSYLWFTVTVVALVLWPLLRGSWVAWWVQLAGVGLALVGLFQVWGRTSDTAGFSAFVPGSTIALLGALLGAAWLLLLLPPVRRFCDDRATGPRTVAGALVAALCLGIFPAMALSLESRLPSRGNLEATPNVDLAGADARAPSVFYVGGERDEVCLLILEPRSSSRSCGRYPIDSDYFVSLRTEHVLAWLLPTNVVRVEVVYGSGRVVAANALGSSPRGRVFYATGALNGIHGIRAYDAMGAKVVVRCRYC